jgi:hypothetical protein
MPGMPGMDDELRDLLRELVESTGAEAAAIVQAASEPAASGELKAVPLGMGGLLEVRYAGPAGADGRPAAIERTSRALRACLRRWGEERFPPLFVQRSHGFDRSRVRDRIQSYLRAFANTPGVSNAAITLHDEVAVAAEPLDELQRETIPFLLKQLAAEARTHKGETSHVEVVREDLCAFAFWVDAALIAFTRGDFSSDFLRHRARLVTREIGQLLPYLDDDPEAPAMIAPLPE